MLTRAAGPLGCGNQGSSTGCASSERRRARQVKAADSQAGMQGRALDAGGDALLYAAHRHSILLNASHRRACCPVCLPACLPRLQTGAHRHSRRLVQRWQRPPRPPRPRARRWRWWAARCQVCVSCIAFQGACVHFAVPGSSERPAATRRHACTAGCNHGSAQPPQDICSSWHTIS